MRRRAPRTGGQKLTRGEIRINATIVMRPTGQLVPYARNARTHTPEQVAQIAASIQRYGFTNPVLIDEHQEIIAGHGRVLAAELLAMPECPTIELNYLTDAEKRAYRIGDNKLALNAGWDEDLLNQELARLSDEHYDLSVIGFSERELTRLLDGLGEGGDAPGQEVPASWAVVIECRDETDQLELIERMQFEGRKVRGSIA